MFREFPKRGGMHEAVTKLLRIIPALFKTVLEFELAMTLP
jgi:hypothetical protein